MSNLRRTLLLALFASVALFGCGDDDPTPGGGTDVADDGSGGDAGGSDAGDDATEDAGDDAAVDTTDDAAADVGDDTGDAGRDAVEDTGDDTAVDAGDDGAADTGDDAAADTGDDAGADAGDDAAGDAADDTGDTTDAGDDAAMDVVNDTVDDTANDASPDTTPDVAEDTGPDCPGVDPPVGEITGTEGLAFSADGETMYFSQSGGVGRWTAEGGVESNWVALDGETTVWGLAYREMDGQLFVGTPGGRGSIYQIDTTAERPAARAIVTGAGSANGLALNADGTLYYTDFAGGHVYQVDREGNATQVTLTTMTQPNGLYFERDGSLLVVSYGGGQVYRLALDDMGREARRATLAETRFSLDGITQGADGRTFVTDNASGSLIGFAADFSTQETIATGIPAAATVTFGGRTNTCNTLWVASSGTLGSAATSTTAPE